MVFKMILETKAHQCLATRKDGCHSWILLPPTFDPVRNAISRAKFKGIFVEIGTYPTQSQLKEQHRHVVVDVQP